MLTNAKIALSLALFVATASGAMAASKHAAVITRRGLTRR
jgi:hypothetical protein